MMRDSLKSQNVIYKMEESTVLNRIDGQDDVIRIEYQWKKII